ncbi:MAG: Na+/H+ antiporter NhaA [Cyclobacteriaceae bacterium]|jgi:Na+/H+ antiporter NhaA
MTFTNNVKKLFENEKTGRLILVFTTAISLFLSSSPWQTAYINFWHIDLLVVYYRLL